MDDEQDDDTCVLHERCHVKVVPDPVPDEIGRHLQPMSIGMCSVRLCVCMCMCVCVCVCVCAFEAIATLPNAMQCNATRHTHQMM